MSKPEAASTQAPAQGPVAIKLRKPIAVVDGMPLDAPIAKLTLRPLRAKDLRTYDDRKSSTALAVEYIGRLSGQPAEVVDELEGEDLGEAIAIVNSFFLSIRRPGQLSSDES